MDCVIGVDFDNTVVTYDEVFLRLVRERHLLDASLLKGKQSIRDRVRELPDGEIEWQKLQGAAYGPRMEEARAMEGVPTFVAACRGRRWPVFIVSHKTEYAGYDETRTNLRAAAVAWMTRQRFFEPAGLGLHTRDVFFESTRQAKIERIRSLGCTHFIDDLEETFLEPTFPPQVEQILFAAHGGPCRLTTARCFTSWQQIYTHFFEYQGLTRMDCNQ